jgi:hypothetical protein
MEGRIQGDAGTGQNATANVNARLSQQFETTPSVARVGIGRADHDTTEPLANDQIGARRRSTPGAAGLQRDIKRRADQRVSGCPCAGDCVRLCMRRTSPFVKPFPKNQSIPHDHRTDGWIGVRAALPMSRQSNRSAHPVLIAATVGRVHDSLPATCSAAVSNHATTFCQ